MRRPRLTLVALGLLAACDDTVAPDPRPGVGPADQRTLALLATRGDQYRLAIADADGSDIVILPGEGRESQPAWSPDGTQLAFVRELDGGLADIGVRDVETGEVWMLTSTSDAHETEPTWSPDGRRIAYTRAGGIWEQDVAGGTPRQLIRGGSNPAWAADGRLAYVATDLTVGTPVLWVRPADGGPAVAVLPDSTAIARSPSWSRDGRLAWIRVDACCFGRQHSAVMVTDSSLANSTPLARDSAIFATPSWSPSADRLVVTRVRADDVGLWIIDAASGSKQRLTTSNREGEPVYFNAYARWRPRP